MPVNRNWDRWIFASTSKHFNDVILSIDASVKYYIEGQPHTIQQDDQRAFEYRQDGPYYTERTRGDWRIYIEINVLIQHAMNDENFHGMRVLCGIAESAFYGMIPVFRYGDGPDDDGSQLGCLMLMQDKATRERIQTSHFGQIDPKYPIEQATVEGHYEMFLHV